MRTLMTGRGTSGSWSIRGQQLGHAIGAEVMPDAAHVDGFDAVILVKRTTGNLIERLHRAKARIVYDVVDGWKQPEGNDWPHSQCIAWLTSQVQAIRPAGIVAATKAMARDCEAFGVPVLYLPHHARPGLAINPIRPEVKTVGYSGGVHYLGMWRAQLERECKRRGWRFVVGVDQLAEVDIVVALREATGYAARAWKSGVKLSNGQGSGTPIICGREAGYLETACGAERWADTPEELTHALDELTGHEAREQASKQLLESAITLDVVAKEYKAWLRSL